MHTYQLWIRLSPTQTAHVQISADTAIQAKMLGESIYGSGNVLNYTEIN
jgi:hypothetical protein